MSDLSNKIYEYLSRTKRKMDLRTLYTKFGISKPLMESVLQQLVSERKLETASQSGHKNYRALEAGNPAAKIEHYIMKPYAQPSLLTERQREIEAQRAAFPSRFN